MKLPKKNFEQFSCILIVPDMYARYHLRYIVNMIMGKLRFKSLFIHTESVMATYAMALPSACVVDIGSSKINICCIDEGLVLTKSVIRRNFGGDDINELLLRMMCRSKSLHFFPKNVINLQSHYHRVLIE